MSDRVSAVIRFNDIVEKAGMRHHYSCRQRIRINDAGLIDSIIQEDIPEETTAMRAFLDRAGIMVIDREC